MKLDCINDVTLFRRYMLRANTEPCLWILISSLNFVFGADIFKERHPDLSLIKSYSGINDPFIDRYGNGNPPNFPGVNGLL